MRINDQISKLYDIDHHQAAPVVEFLFIYQYINIPFKMQQNKIF